MRIKLSLLSLLFIFTLIYCGGSEDKKSSEQKVINEIWQTEQVLKTPESVLYDQARDLLYVANIYGKPTDKDNNGFISRLSTDGKILDLKWVEGMDAPKGMGVFGNHLFVTDIDSLHKIDIEAGKIIKSYPGENAQFLNDITIDTDGTVYVSDMVANVVYRLKDDQFGVWLDDDQLQSCNGLFMQGSDLLIGVSGSVLKVDRESKEITTYIADTGGIDGLVTVGDGHFIVSDWQGRVHLIHTKKEKKLLLDTTPENINAADIEFIVKDRLLLVPTFFDNRVVAYKLSK